MNEFQDCINRDLAYRLYYKAGFRGIGKYKYDVGDSGKHFPAYVSKEIEAYLPKELVFPERFGVDDDQLRGKKYVFRTYSKKFENPTEEWFYADYVPEAEKDNFENAKTIVAGSSRSKAHALGEALYDLLRLDWQYYWGDRRNGKLFDAEFEKLIDRRTQNFY